MLAKDSQQLATLSPATFPTPPFRTFQSNSAEDARATHTLAAGEIIFQLEESPCGWVALQRRRRHTAGQSDWVIELAQHKSGSSVRVRTAPGGGITRRVLPQDDFSGISQSPRIARGFIEQQNSNERQREKENVGSSASSRAPPSQGFVGALKIFDF